MLTLLQINTPRLVFFLHCQKRDVVLNASKGHEETINELIEKEFGIHATTSPSNNTNSHQPQPDLTVKSAKKHNPNYYANAALKVIGRIDEAKALGWSADLTVGASKLRENNFYIELS